MMKSLIVATVLSAAIAASVSHASERMGSQQRASFVDDASFEFRGSGRTLSGFENMIWRFSQDGRVVSEGAISRIFYWGGMGEQFGLQGTGTWHRAGDKICVVWDAYSRRFDGCYDVLIERGRIVHFAGPQFITGTMERSAQVPPQAAADKAAACTLTFQVASATVRPAAPPCGGRPR